MRLSPLSLRTRFSAGVSFKRVSQQGSSSSSTRRAALRSARTSTRLACAHPRLHNRPPTPRVRLGCLRPSPATPLPQPRPPPSLTHTPQPGALPPRNWIWSYIKTRARCVPFGAPEISRKWPSCANCVCTLHLCSRLHNNIHDINTNYRIS